jgi:hypothetical protein
MEEPEQTDTRGGMPGSEKDGALPPLPIPVELENDGGSERILHEKNVTSSIARKALFRYHIIRARSQNARRHEGGLNYVKTREI